MGHARHFRGGGGAGDCGELSPGLQGWTQWQRRCGFSTTTLTVDGNGPNNLVYPNDIYGFYVYYATSTTSLTNACMSFSYSPGYPAIT